MTKSKKIFIALIISIVVTIFGGAMMSASILFEFFEPLAITLLSLGGVGTLIFLIEWIFDMDKD